MAAPPFCSLDQTYYSNELNDSGNPMPIDSDTGVTYSYGPTGLTISGNNTEISFGPFGAFDATDVDWEVGYRIDSFGTDYVRLSIIQGGSGIANINRAIGAQDVLDFYPSGAYIPDISTPTDVVIRRVKVGSTQVISFYFDGVLTATSDPDTISTGSIYFSVQPYYAAGSFSDTLIENFYVTGYGLPSACIGEKALTSEILPDSSGNISYLNVLEGASSSDELTAFFNSLKAQL